MKWNPFALEAEAKNEIYKLIDKNFKKLPKNKDGSFNELDEGFFDNDVDALRHAYVSGVFTQEYGEPTADMLGRMNEYFPGWSFSSTNTENSTNMDLWNNEIGRKYGKKTKSRTELFKRLMKALKNDELIINLENDKRKYLGNKEILRDLAGLVIVLDENKNGKNRIFYDLDKKLVMKKSEFVNFIKNGNYPNYELRKKSGDEIPVSKKDIFPTNNLG